MNIARGGDLRRIAFCALPIIVLLVLGYRQILHLWQTWCIWSEEQSNSPQPVQERHIFQENIQIGEIESNCGLLKACAADSFPVYLSTGTPDDKSPKLCVGGKVIIQTNINGGGRGLNVAVIDPTQFQVVSIRNFDTYRYDSATMMDAWLEKIVTHDIVIAFTFDEASTKLNHSTRAILNKLGSGKVQDLSFRAQWFLITQKGTKGFSVYERISFPRNRSWGDRLEFQKCVPRLISKKLHPVDPPARVNAARTQFCQSKTGHAYQAICTQSRFETFLPALMTNRSLIGNRALSVPIYLFAGNDFEILLAALDSLLHQPGILLPAVSVVYNSSQTSVSDLIKLFGVNGMATLSTQLTWQQMVELARNDTVVMHPSQSYFIVVAPDTIPSPDFLFYFAQTSFALFRDSTLSAVSAWSPNCYNLPGERHLAFRVHGTPEYAALIAVRSSQGDIVVPDVSRVQGPRACHPPSLNADNWIERPQDLVQDRYFHKLVMLQQRSQTVNLTQLLLDCSLYNFSENGNYVLYFNEDQAILKTTLDCLGIVDGRFTEYQKIIRVTVASSGTLLIILSNSTFYKARPIANNSS